MLPLSIIETIDSYKIKFLCKAYIDGLYHRVGKYFYLYVKDFHNEEEYVGLTIGLLPKPDTVFFSKYADIKALTKMLPALNGRNVIFVDPGNNKNPYKITPYNLHRLLSPINHKHNILTELEQIKVELRNCMSTETLVTGCHGGVEGIRVDPYILTGVIL